jgi:hypothetical protein
MAMSRSIARPAFGLFWCGVALAGCGGTPLLGPSIASYGASNILSPAGYAQTKLDETHFKVTATGTEATPKARVEKIARARAAQIGVEQKLQYFKVASVQHGVKCEKRQAGYKSEPTPASSRPTVVLDVVYAKDAADPTFASSAETFQALSNELAAEVVSPEAKAAATQETRAGCGQG